MKGCERMGPGGACDSLRCHVKRYRRYPNKPVAPFPSPYQSSGRGIDILTFSFRQEKVEQVMSDEELLALMESRKEKEAARASAGNGNAEEGESEQASVEAVAAFQEAQKASRQELIPLASATQDRCGAKAAACSQLLQAAKASGGAFEAPGGVVLPFGVMDIALTEAGLKVRSLDRSLAAAAHPTLRWSFPPPATFPHPPMCMFVPIRACIIPTHRLPLGQP